MGRIAGRFVRVEPRRRARAFVLGLLSGLPRKNCWTLAEHAGDANPHGLQHLLSRARWDADAVRDDIRGFVVEHLHHEDAVLVVDETGDLKKGTGTVGVQRQYTGTAGRRPHREQPGRRLPRLLNPARARGDRPGAVCSALLDRGPGPLPGRRDTRRRRLRHCKHGCSTRACRRTLTGSVAEDPLPQQPVPSAPVEKDRGVRDTLRGEPVAAQHLLGGQVLQVGGGLGVPRPVRGDRGGVGGRSGGSWCCWTWAGPRRGASGGTGRTANLCEGPRAAARGRAGSGQGTFTQSRVRSTALFQPA